LPEEEFFQRDFFPLGSGESIFFGRFKVKRQNGFLPPAVVILMDSN